MMFRYDFEHGPPAKRIFEFIVWFFDRWRFWAQGVFVYQAMVIVFKLLGKLDWPWWVVLLPVEVLGVMFVAAGVVMWSVFRKR